jgi:hypothetical protein
MRLHVFSKVILRSTFLTIADTIAFRASIEPTSYEKSPLFCRVLAISGTMFGHSAG